VKVYSEDEDESEPVAHAVATYSLPDQKKV
jgi:hypothetical protein